MIDDATLEAELRDLSLMVGESAWHAKDLAAARRAYELALPLGAGGEAHARLGRIALLAGRPEEAARQFSAAIGPWRDDVRPAHCVNLAVALGRMERFAEALRNCEEALSLDPGFIPAHIERAALFEECGSPGQARAACLAGLALEPENPDLRYLLAVCQLQAGDWVPGWRNYEYRTPRLELAAKLDEYPEWQGEPLAGKTILVLGEQGVGDQIMFARYLPELVGKVVLFTRPELARLFALALPDARILTSDRELVGLEPDYWLAMGSLPLRSGDTPSGGTAYLYAPSSETERFAALVPRAGRLRVGLCWRGNPQHRRDQYRSIPWAEVKALLEVPRVDFYSLQAGDRESGLANLVSYCHDFADTAAAIAQLDLVITADTSVLHLAGAMGKPVWGLIGRPADWRWGSRAWYPGARLFDNRRGWAGVIAEVAREIPASSYSPAAGPWTAAPSHTAARECRYGPMCWPRNDAYIGRALSEYGEYSESEVELFRRILQPGDMVVEAGANIGALTVALADIVGYTGRVHAFEPQPAYAELLRRNALEPWVVKHRQALGAEAGKITLRQVPLDVVHAPGWEATGAEFTAARAAIDDYRLARCNLIKIDVDGAELDILRGAACTIARHRPYLYVENDKPLRYPELLPWMHAHGYRLYQHEAPLFNPRNFAANPVNVFGSTISLMILAVPMENKQAHPGDWGLQRIRAEA